MLIFIATFTVFLIIGVLWFWPVTFPFIKSLFKVRSGCGDARRVKGFRFTAKDLEQQARDDWDRDFNYLMNQTSLRDTGLTWDEHRELKRLQHLTRIRPTNQYSYSSAAIQYRKKMLVRREELEGRAEAFDRCHKGMLELS